MEKTIENKEIEILSPKAGTATSSPSEIFFAFELSLP
jgi:hypothetical protein